jgi:hypothetical protein
VIFQRDVGQVKRSLKMIDPELAKRMNWGASTTEPANVVPMAAK